MEFRKSRVLGEGPLVILAGIDEAGYGPLLGPLVVAATAFRLGGIPAPDGSTWPAWRLPGDLHLSVADSKRTYSRAKGCASLENVVLAFAASTGCPPSDLARFLETSAVEGAREAFSRPWYSHESLPLPREVSPGELSRRALEARECFADAAIDYLGASMCVVDAVRYNEIIDRVGNKSTLLFGRASILMRRLWECHGREGVVLTVDRHGGRKFYAGLLDIAFPEAVIEILGESADESRYRLSCDGREMFVRFKVKGESADPATALASMWAKYTRELFMELFNRYWLSKASNVSSTAGYWVDGERFIADLIASGAVTQAEALTFTRCR